MISKITFWILFPSLLLGCGHAKKETSATPRNQTNASVEAWFTRADQTMLLQKQPNEMKFSTQANGNTIIDIDTAAVFQTVDGFGYSLTGGSAQLIYKMDAAARASLLNELFSSGENAIGISYLRISIGASDLDAAVFSYDDLPAGQTDPTLAHFTLSKDTEALIPVLKQILSVNPKVKIMASPWSPPVWMKDNKNSMGGSLLPQYYAVYAQYFVKYIEQMKALGIIIDAITPQNEPQHGGNNPSMLMSALEQADFIKNHLGPAFKAAGIPSKIIIWDHNCDHPEYPITVLNDPGAKQFINGSAFHLYNGDISALTTVHNAHPDKELYFTEQWTGAKNSFEGDLIWHLKNVVIGSMRNWSKIALEWNLASDPAYEPHTPGGCTECKGALTIDGNTIRRNVSYYIIAHASKFIPQGSVRIGSTASTSLPNAAFKTPSGKTVLIILNEANTATSINIRCTGKMASCNLPAATVASFVW